MSLRSRTVIALALLGILRKKTQAA